MACFVGQGAFGAVKSEYIRRRVKEILALSRYMSNRNVLL